MIDVKTATVSVLSVSTLTTYLQQNLNAELALVIVGISTLLGMCLTVIYHHDRISTLFASVGLAAALFGFLPAYTFLSLHLQDITAFVDFDAFADAAIAAGFTVSGLTSQRQFLLHNGLLEIAEEVSVTGDTQAQVEVAQQIKTLTLPGEMGERFLVVGLQKDLEIEIKSMTLLTGRR